MEDSICNWLDFVELKHINSFVKIKYIFFVLFVGCENEIPLHRVLYVGYWSNWNLNLSNLTSETQLYLFQEQNRNRCEFWTLQIEKLWITIVIFPNRWILSGIWYQSFCCAVCLSESCSVEWWGSFLISMLITNDLDLRMSFSEKNRAGIVGASLQKPKKDE